MLTPLPRGALSAAVLEALRGDPGTWPAGLPPADGAGDAALTLWVMYELHYHGFDEVRRRLGVAPGAARCPRRAGGGVREASCAARYAIVRTTARRRPGRVALRVRR